MKKKRRLSFSKSVGRPLASFGIHMLVRFVPRLSRDTGWRVGRIGGWFAFHFSGGRRKIALANLEIAFGQTKTRCEKRRIALCAMQNFVSTLLLLFWAPRLSAENLFDYIEIDDTDLDLLRQMAGRGKGFIGLTLHYGDWELLGLTMGYLGMPVTAASKQIGHDYCAKIISGLRSQSGNRLLPNCRAAFGLVQAIEQGRNLGILIDLNAGRRGGVWLDFFGLPIFHNTCAARLALQTGAPILYVVAHPLGQGRAKLLVRQVRYEITDDRSEDIRRISRDCLEVCESIIRSHPEHWLWSYKRWKRRPHPFSPGFPYYSRHVSVKGMPPPSNLALDPLVLGIQ